MLCRDDRWNDAARMQKTRQRHTTVLPRDPTLLPRRQAHRHSLPRNGFRHHCDNGQHAGLRDGTRKSGCLHLRRRRHHHGRLRIQQSGHQPDCNMRQALWHPRIRLRHTRCRPFHARHGHNRNARPTLLPGSNGNPHGPQDRCL